MRAKETEACIKCGHSNDRALPVQHDDYITLKERATAHILSGADGAPEGMATIEIALETLKVAEYLTPMLTQALKN